MAKCIICGKEIKETMGKGRNKGYCSEECKRKGRVKASTKYLVKRYQTDEEFRKKRIKQNVESNKRRREARKEKVMQELCEELYNAKSSGDIRAILEKKVKLKTELYYYA